MTANQPDLKYWVAFSNFPKIGPARLSKLLNFFPSLETAFKASAAGLVQAGIEESLALEFVAARINIIPDQLMERLAKEQVRIITLNDEEYPVRLKMIYSPPSVIYHKGVPIPDELNLAVVGTRKLSVYGRQVAEMVVKELVRNNLTIVSGLALGIDSLAHTITLDNNGRTIAVLGSGLDKQNIYPHSNRYLADKIVAQGGQIISEFPLGTPPLKHNFPQRNRIISGLSLGTLVIEAAEKSGSLITANFALEQNREIFAVPGSIFSANSAGPNKLIKQGAIPVTNAADILATLDLSQVTSYIKTNIEVTDEENKILNVLDFEPLHIDEISRLSSVPIAVLNSNLMLMEIKGLIRNLGGMQYIRIH